MRRVDPTIAAAWIAGGVGALGIIGTVTATIVGSRNTKRATEATIAAGAATTTATLTAAREDRLWEKQCAAYEATLEALLYRQQKLRHDLRMYRLDEDSEEKLKDFFGSYEPPGWFPAQARLDAYASEPVMDAFKVTIEAHASALLRYQRYSTMADDNKLAAQSGQSGTAHGGEETIAALRAVNLAIEDAEAKDDQLIRLIRDELRSKPEAATLPATPPIKRHRLWRRTS